MKPRYIIQSARFGWKIWDRQENSFIWTEDGEKVALWKDPDLVIESRDKLEKGHLDNLEKESILA